MKPGYRGDERPGRRWDERLGPRYNERHRKLTTASVARMVDAADDTCVGYLFRNLLRVRSSGIHVLLVDMAAVGDGCDDEGKGACSEELSRVMPRSTPWKATPTKRCANYARGFDIRTQAGEPDGTQSSLSISEQTVRRPTIIHPSDSCNRRRRRRGIDQFTTGTQIGAQKLSTWW